MSAHKRPARGRHRLVPPFITRGGALRAFVAFVALAAIAMLLVPRAGESPHVNLTDGNGAAATVDYTGVGGVTASDGLDDKGQPVGPDPKDPTADTRSKVSPGVERDEMLAAEKLLADAINGGQCGMDGKTLAQTRDYAVRLEPIHACDTPYYPVIDGSTSTDGTGQLFRSPTGMAYEPMPEHPDTETDVADRKEGTASPEAAQTGAACPTVLDGVDVSDQTAEAANNIIANTDYAGEVLGKGSRTVSTSDHPAGYAVDYLVGTGNVAEGNKIRDYVINNRDKLGVLYVIWQQTYYNHRGSSRMEDRGSVTANHYDHVHVSFIRTPRPGSPLTC